jgi:vitamin B12 transporter
LVLIDGVPQNKQDASGSVSLEHLLLENVERVEVVRGNVSAIYGSGAIGGVIQIFTRAAQKEPSARIVLEVGPRATAKLAAQASLSAGDTSITAGLSRLTTDGFSAINNAQQTGANPDNDGYQNVSANASVTHRISKDHQFGVQLLQGDAKLQIDVNASPSDINSSTMLMNQATVFTDDMFGSWRSRLSYSEQTEKNMYISRGAFYVGDDGFNTRVNVLRWVNTVPVGNDWLGTAGFEEQNQHADTTTADPASIPYTFGKERNTHAIFAGLEGCFGPATLQFNVRNDYVGDLQKNTGYLGAGYALTDAVKVTASASTAFNAPPLGYLYDPISGNSMLKPELAQSSEVGLQYASGSHLLRATYFDTRVQEQLTYDFNTSLFANIDQARNTGVELSYKGTVGTTDIRASLTSQNPVNDLTGEALARRAKSMVTLGVSHPVSAWRFGADLRYVGQSVDSYSAGVPKNMLAAYSVLDASATYRYSSQVQFTTRVDNLTDEKYQTVYGYNQQPLSLYVGVVWTPKL